MRAFILRVMGVDAPPKVVMTESQLEARLKYFAGIVLVSVFGGAMFTIIYSLVFVTQPMNGIAPADKLFFKILETMITFLAGSLSTLMTLKATPQQVQPPAEPPAAPPAPAQDAKSV